MSSTIRVLSCVIVAGGFGYFLYWYIVQKRKEEEEKRNDEKDYNSPQKREPDDLLDTIINSCNKRDNRLVNIDEDAKLLCRIQNMDPTKYGAYTCLAATKWLILYHNNKIITSDQTEEEISVIHKQTDKDMEQAWGLLDSISKEDLAKEDCNSVDMLQLDIAQRLRTKIDELPGIFDRIVERNHLDDDEEVTLFGVAALLGQWKKMYELGQNIFKKGKLTREYLHKQALAQKGAIDYSVLYDLSQTQPNAEMETLPWLEYEIQNIKLTFTGVSCANKEDERRHQHNMTRQKDFAKGLEGRRLHIKGAVANMLGFSRCAMPVVGVANTDNFFMKGYAIVTGAGKVVKQSEEYALDRLHDSQITFDDQDLSSWKGTLTINTEPPENCPPLELYHALITTFALRFDLKPSPFQI